MMGTGPLRRVVPIILAADYIPHQRWLSASGSEVPSRRSAAAAAIDSAVNLWLFQGYASTGKLAAARVFVLGGLCFYILSQHCHVRGGRGGKLPPSQ